MGVGRAKIRGLHQFVKSDLPQGALYPSSGIPGRSPKLQTYSDT